MKQATPATSIGQQLRELAASWAHNQYQLVVAAADFADVETGTTREWLPS